MVRSEQFERAFDAEIMESERLRAGILAVMLVFAGALTAFVVGSSTNNSGVFGGLRWAVGPSLMMVLAIYEGLMWVGLGRVIDGRWPARPFMRYLNVVVEITLVSAAIGVIALVVDPVLALAGPAPLIYVGFIVISPLVLDHRLCLLVGLLAGAQYLLIVAGMGDAIAASPAADTIVAEPQSFVLRAISMATMGVLAAGVASQVKRRTLISLHANEERERVLDLFGQQVSPEVVDKLLAQKSGLDSELRHVCIMFMDIRGFTTFSEGRPPDEVIAFLNTLWDASIEAVNSHHGIVNKFLGDGFMAIFGAPISDGQDSRNAVRAAQELLERLDALVASGAIPPTRIGIGLHAGEAVTGNVGSSKRREYSVIGDVVNTASRIESLNKQFGSALLVSDAVWQALGDQAPPGERLPPIEVQGRVEPVVVYRLA